MGKGIAASIIAATARAVLRSAARFADVASAVDAASEALTLDLANAGVFVTAFHARLDMDSGVVSFVDAGHGLAIRARRRQLAATPLDNPVTLALLGQ